MATSSQTARKYFAALAGHDLEAACACCTPSVAEQTETRFGPLFEAFPDLWIEVIDTTTQRERCAVRWRALGTFMGPGELDGIRPNGAAIHVEGCDMVHVKDDLIVQSDFYLDLSELLRQLDVLPPPRRLASRANARTRVQTALYGAEPEVVAAGVWVLRAGHPRRTNRFLIEGDDGLTVFDPGIRQLAPAIRIAGVRLGGIARVILSHADSLHRGGAPGLGAPVYCHELERDAAESRSHVRDYWKPDLLSPGRQLLLKRLFVHMDGGPVKIEGTLADGDEVAGFSVLHLPGHAPGLIGLWRAEDGLALVSDCVWNLRGPLGLRSGAHIPHPALTLDVEQARASVRRLISLNPQVVWPALGKPLSGEDGMRELERAASAQPA